MDTIRLPHLAQIKELFLVEESLSPRLEWLKTHQVRTHDHPDMEDMRWAAWLPLHDWSPTESNCYAPGSARDVGYGETEADAIIDLAKKNKIKLWNQP